MFSGECWCILENVSGVCEECVFFLENSDVCWRFMMFYTPGVCWYFSGEYRCWRMLVFV